MAELEPILFPASEEQFTIKGRGTAFPTILPFDIPNWKFLLGKKVRVGQTEFVCAGVEYCLTERPIKGAKIALLQKS